MSKTSNTMPQRDDFDGLVDEVLAAAGGDARRAIIGLVLGQHELESQIQAIVSAGYVRRNCARVH